MVKEGYKKTKYGLIPDSWDFLQLKDIAKVNMGSSPPSSTYNEDGDGLPFFQGNAEFGSLYPEENQWCTDPQKVADKDNILISVRAPVGDINIAPYRCCIGRGLAAIEGEETSNKFIYYCLKQFNPKLQSYSQGSTFSSINKKVLETFFVNYPPLPEQKKIASILSSVDKSIEKTDEVIEETKELKKGLMQELLTKGIGHSEFKEVNINGKTMSLPVNWDVKMLKNVTQINKNNISTSTPEDYEIEYIDISSINCIGKIKETTFYNYGNAPSRAKRLVNIDDVIVSTVRPYLKSFSIINEDKENLVCSTGFAVLTPKSNMETEYIYYFVWSNHFVNYMKRLMRGTSYPAVNKNDVANTFIPVPPLEEQKKIASILSSVDTKIKKEEEYKAKLERLKKGLMQKLLTGEIRVNTDMEV
jgi:type I restriction enzyme S subunit